ncbi:MAG: SET domain-containing protein [Ferruginibacter sp.]|nr:SET domain-containing protein [Ferruginibacter sp.]
MVSVEKLAIAEIVQHPVTGEKALCSLVAFKKGDVISNFEAENVLSEPTYLTVQTDEHKHITLSPSYLQNINHSCSPNVFFDTTSMQLIALRQIEANEELTFFYPSTEWEMSQSFNCFCGSKNCLRTIKGAKFVSSQVIKSYRLTDFIKKQFKKG